MRYLILPLFVLALSSASALGQQPVAVGQGSYASAPPPGLAVDQKRNVDLVQETENHRLYLVNDEGRPIPSNKWYENVILNQYGTGLWAMPHKVDATAEGFEIFYPTRFDSGGSRTLTDFPLVITGKEFKPVDSRAKQWTDWTVAFRMFESEKRFVDVTLGEGMPYAWCEFTGVQPLIALGGNGGKGSRGKNAARFFGLDGTATQLPMTGDAMGITYEGRSYSVFAPDGTRFAQSADGIAVTFTARSTFLVIAPIPTAKDISVLHQHAFAVPRDTRLSWNYDRTAGTITTTWHVTAEPLKGDSKDVIQGFLPHHWRENISPISFSGISYPTIRGQMKCAVGQEFTIRYPFNGILPNLPAEGRASFDRNRMASYLEDNFADPARKLGSDTYWAGKSMEQQAQAGFIAAQLHDRSAPAIIAKVNEAMENWLTYTPGEKDHFFAYYPRRKGLVGFNVSYGSQHFTDNHFHYGYFVYTAGLLSQLQPDFADRYGAMARLIAKTYANYDRKDSRFPFFRTFDIWRGHSFADGNGFPDGNNQESTGEAINSWAGMILLGEALGDEDLTAAGVMGYSFETRATLEYWFNSHGDVFPPAYAHKACGMIWCNSIVWGTWFTASPAWIYGIQWLPAGPHMAFYDHDPGLIRKIYADLTGELDAFETKEASKKKNYVRDPDPIKSAGGELGSYHLGFLMQVDPATVVEEIDKLWEEPGDKVAHDPWMANIYYQAKRPS